MKRLCSRVLPFLLYLMPAITWAATINPEDTEIFHLSLLDPSRNFLGQLFGTVGTVLHGTSGQLLGTLFKYFNTGILAVASVFLVWTTVKVVIGAAHEGGFMRSQTKPAFNIIRTVLGMGLLVPSASTGYSVIQVIVMWVVLQGAGFANTAWNRALDYFQEGGQLFTPPTTDLESLVDFTGTVLEANICMFYHEKLEKDLRQESKDAIASGSTSIIDKKRVKFFGSFRPQYKPGAMAVEFPAKRGNDDAGCGRIYWGQSDSSKNGYAGRALRAVIAGTSSVAKRIADPRAGDTAKRLTDDAKASLVGAAADWSNLLLPARAQTSNEGDLQSFFREARKQGWIYAGSYYYELTKIQRQFDEASSIKTQFTNTIFGLQVPNVATDQPAAGHLTFPLQQWDQQKLDESKVAYPGSNFKGRYNFGSGAAVQAKALAREIEQANSEVMVPKIEMGGLGIVALFVLPVFIAINLVLAAITATGDPILKMQTIGGIMMAVVIVVWIVSAIVVFALSLGLSTLSSVNPAGFALRDTMSIILPFLFGIVGIMFVQGAVCAVYIPLIPFIVYTFTVLGWFVHVIEAMVAAPLVALGVTHPEGHDMLGKGEQAVMLLMGVFLRPVLMVIGLLAGMLLSNVMLTILNVAFVKIVAASLSIFGFLVAFGIYCALVVQLITQCYGLIYMVPDRVMRWLGAGVESSMAGQALQAAEQSQTQTAQAASKGGEAGISAGKEGGEAGMKSDQRKAQLSKGKEGGAISGGGPKGGATGGGKGAGKGAGKGGGGGGKG